jgi:hypothetical protein
VDSNYWDEKYSVEEYIYTKTENRFVVEYCTSLPGKRAIDLAGGEGRNSVWLAKQGWQVENIDFSEVALDKYLQFAQAEHVAGHCTATCQDAVTFSPQSTPVDLGIIAYLQIDDNKNKYKLMFQNDKLNQKHINYCVKLILRCGLRHIKCLKMRKRLIHRGKQQMVI